MSYLAKGKKEDLLVLAEEFGEVTDPHLRVIDLKTLIINSEKYEEDFAKELLNTIIENRKVEEAAKERAQEQQAERLAKEKELERNFELEKLRLQLETQRTSTPLGVTTSDPDSELPKFELKKLIPYFNAKQDDMGLFLNLFERQLKFLKIQEVKWVAYLIGVLPAEVAKLIAREPEQKAQEYAHVKEVLLKRFKLTSERFRQLFCQHRKAPESTWRDFYFEIRSYYEGWLAELDVTNFEQLKDLMLADQIKRKTPPEVREHFLDDWHDWNSPGELADKLDAYDNQRLTSKKDSFFRKRIYEKPKEDSTRLNYNKKTVYGKGNERSKTDPPTEGKPNLVCYGCGKPGFIKAQCPVCSPPKKKVSTNQMKAFATITKGSPVTLLDVTICEVFGRVCADTGSTHSIAGQYLYHLFKENNLPFQKTELTLQLANGLQTLENCLTTQVPVYLEDRKIMTNFIILPDATNNRTLLGTDFLEAAGVVLDLANKNWFFQDKPKCKYPFGEEIPLTPILDKSQIEANICQLREGEGEHLNPQQREDLSALLVKYDNIFKLGGGATPLIEHHINTGDHPPVAVPPYRMSPARKNLLRKELDDLLEKNIIEECESAYGAPVVLIPKPNGDMRLCIDYRKLNAITVPDVYPLPRMDDLLQDAKHTTFMSTIDLKSGYHQVNVYPPDKDKTAFVCPFGTFRFNKMPFGLRNAPATFQRLIDLFRRDLPVLAYLDDIIVLSPSFEQHLKDLEAVFKKLIKFNLCANREKCHFACSRVKYLGFWITPQGIQVDKEKVASIREISPPKNVKQLQSFLQTCSWYRKFIPNFSDLARPLSQLTKKNTQWNWTAEQQKSFEVLKDCLVTPPILKQADFSKPFIIRTDASNYALGAVLLQGQGPEERPVEYASRLLKSAEQNYSTTEREALAVIWALNKFRGYIEGQEIIVASDHQPLRWLMSLKSPSGRLARWALQIQDVNLKIEYVPGKANVIADMLSRPSCLHDGGECEVCTVSITLPSKASSELREEQLRDDELKKIINTFEAEEKDENFTTWTSRGYLMNQGVLYRYAPEVESEEAQLVIPQQERERILQEHHDAPMAGHYGAEGTYHRIAQRYYWTGMRKYITDYVKNCPECNRYKASNQKPAGLLQTPVQSQRFEVISMDLFGPLPESKDGKKWIFILEDVATRWVELFSLPNATAAECAKVLLEEVLMRYGLPRRIISDNGTQFVSAVIQQLCSLLEIHQSLIPVYHPEANPVERKNRDLKPRLAILVQDQHSSWPEHLPHIRFALNSAKCDSTGYTAAYLTFGRELRTTDDVTHDIRSVIENDNFVPEITPYLKRFAKIAKQVKERLEQKQDKRKKYADKRRSPAPQYSPGDHVYVNLHPISSATKGKTAKFVPKRDGPYVIVTQKSPTSYVIASLDKPTVPLGTYHTSAIKICPQKESTGPVHPLRKRGRPRKERPTEAGSSSRRHRNLRGRM